jgi:hypothetical protein
VDTQSDKFNARCSVHCDHSGHSVSATRRHSCDNERMQVLQHFPIRNRWGYKTSFKTRKSGLGSNIAACCKKVPLEYLHTVAHASAASFLLHICSGCQCPRVKTRTCVYHCPVLRYYASETFWYRVTLSPIMARRMCGDANKPCSASVRLELCMCH